MEEAFHPIRRKEPLDATKRRFQNCSCSWPDRSAAGEPSQNEFPSSARVPYFGGRRRHRSGHRLLANDPEPYGCLFRRQSKPEHRDTATCSKSVHPLNFPQQSNGNFRPSPLRKKAILLEIRAEKSSGNPARFSRTLMSGRLMPNSLTPPNPLSMVRAVDLPERPDFRVFWMV